MPKKVDHEARKADFAKAAFEVIAKSGVDGATFRAVASQAGYTTGALVHYIKEKDDLLLSAAEHSAILVRARMERFERDQPGIQGLRLVLYESLPRDKERRGTWKIWIGFWDRSLKNPRVHKLTKARYAEWRKRIHSLLEEAVELGEVSKDLDLDKTTDSLIALIDGIGVQVLLTGNKIARQRQYDLVDYWLDALLLQGKRG